MLIKIFHHAKFLINDKNKNHFISLLKTEFQINPIQADQAEDVNMFVTSAILRVHIF